MYRILRADKDSYITNKIIFSTKPTLSRSTDANVGQAGTLDLFKLYDVTPVASGTSGVELSRLLVHFDLDPIRDLTGSLVNIADPSFKCYLSLKDVYGGQTTPSNFVIAVNPLGKAFSEGRGNDVIGFRDLDAVNWLTASIVGSTVTPWASGGAGYGATTAADLNADYYDSFPAYTGNVPLPVTQSFSRGDEDLFVDVTAVVSATLAGLVPDHGFRISFSGSQETDAVTRFVKRFSSRQSNNTTKHPALVVKYNDSFFDNQTQLKLDYNNRIGTYNNLFGNPTNFFSGSTEVSGSGSIMLELVANRSAYVLATTYSINHQKTITYNSASWTFFSQSFTGSQVSFGSGMWQTGSYYADVLIRSNTTGLSGALNPDGSLSAIPVWKSPDGTVIFDVGPSVTFTPIRGGGSVAGSRNYTTNILNLKDTYVNTDVVTMRVFTMDFDPTLQSFYTPYKSKPRVFQNMLWRIVDPFTGDVLIPFDDSATRLSSDREGMYFKLYMQDIPVNRPYEVQFLVKENGQTDLIKNQGFVFKVVEA